MYNNIALHGLRAYPLMGCRARIIKKKGIDMLEFCVQEIIGGWKQVPCFFGSYEECEEYLDGNNGNYAIVPADSYEVDYLN